MTPARRGKLIHFNPKVMNTLPAVEIDGETYTLGEVQDYLHKRSGNPFLEAALDFLTAALAAPAAAAESPGGLGGWIKCSEQLPEYGQKVDFWQQQHQMMGRSNLPDTIEAKGYSGWFAETPMLQYPTWHDGPLRASFYNNSNGLHQLSLISHWKPTMPPHADH